MSTAAVLVEAPALYSQKGAVPITSDTAGQRRFAASMIVHALRSLQPLFNSNRSDAQYFEAVEALVWICSPGSEMYFDLVDLDPKQARQRLDLALYAELALTVYHEHKDFMRRMYIAMARYSLQEKQRREGRKVPFNKIAQFADEALAYTTSVLEEVRESGPKGPGVRGSHLPSMLEHLGEVATGP